jgi:hypothetical protein
MADTPPRSVGFEGLPDSIRSGALNMLHAGNSTRRVAACLLQQGFRISHNTLARHARSSPDSPVQTNNTLAAIVPVHATNSKPVEPSEQPSSQRLLAEDPFHSRIAHKYRRLDRVLDEAEKVSDFRAVAALDRADTTLMTLHAQVTGRLQQQGPQTNIQIVFQGAPAETRPALPFCDADVVDLAPVQRTYER